MSIPINFNPLGFASVAIELPAGYISVNFLKSTGLQTISLSFPAEQLGEVALEMGDETTSGGPAIFAASTSANAGFQICIVGENVRFDYGGWSGSPTIKLAKGRNRVTLSSETGAYSCNGVSGVAKKLSDFTLYNSISWFSIFRTYLYHGKLFSAKITKDGKNTLSFLPCVDEKGVPCMYDMVSKTPFYNTGDGAFIVGLTAEQATKIANLPSTGGSLTISLPAEIVDGEGNVTNSAVDAAINTAKNNGWTITIQTYTLS